MYDPTFMRQVALAVHEDRVRALQRFHEGRSRTPGTPVHRTLGLYRRLACRLQIRSARVAP
jgi:hypothetical protein